jgi:cytoskeletal protein CcmA (bactofilin family)
MGVESNSRRIELVCPKCDHRQMEPSMVISTLCRACGQHMDIRDGKPVVRPKYATRLATEGKPPVQHPTVGAVIPKKQERSFRLNFFKKMFQRSPVKRSVSCYHCNNILEVVPDAQSSQCAKCGGYISLRDYEVDHAWRRRIQTRGDVTILKTGSIIGVNVQCHHLTVLGVLEAPVECSGDLRIRSHGKIIGQLRCRELHVERGAVVEIQGEVHAERVFIDGKVKAQISCTGTITLEKKAHLQGLARAAGLIARKGAKHTGLMEVVTPAEVERPA